MRARPQIVALLAVLLATSPSPGQPRAPAPRESGTAAPGQPDAAARSEGARLSRQGKQLFDRGDYRQAMARFEASERIASHRTNWYYIGECLRRLGQRRRSLAAYRRYASMLPPDRRAAFEPRLAQLRWESPCQLVIRTVPGGAQIRIDGRQVGATPVRGARLTLELPGGEHTVEVRRAGHRTERRRIAAEFGEPVKLRVHLRRRVATDRRRPRRAARGWQGAPFGGVTVGPAHADYGDSALEVGLALEAGVDGGFRWRRGRWSFGALGAALCTPVDDVGVDDTAAIVLLLGGGIGRLELWRGLFVELRLLAGVSLLTSAREDGALLGGAGSSSRTLATVALRPSLGLGWVVWRGLYIALHPLTLDYSPRHPDYHPSITRVLRYHAAAAVGWF